MRYVLALLVFGAVLQPRSVERRELMELERRVQALEQYRDASITKYKPTSDEEQRFQEWIRIKKRLAKLEERVKELEKND